MLLRLYILQADKKRLVFPEPLEGPLMSINRALSLLLGLWLAAFLASCTSEYRPHNGVISTGNAGRLKVSLPESEQDSTRAGEFRILQETDSIANLRFACKIRLDSSCSETLDNGTYRAEIWISNQISGRTSWFEIAGSSKTVEVKKSPATTIQLDIQSSSVIDSVALGSRENLATYANGKWQVAQLVDSSDALWVRVSSGGVTTWKKYIQAFDGLNTTITPVSPQAPTVFPITTIVLDASNCPWFETTIQGSSNPPGIYDNKVYATDTIRGLGGAWDASTVGRTLWRIQLPDSLKLLNLRSATLVYQTAKWGVRGPGVLPVDFVTQAHRMLRSWKAGNAGYGVENSGSVDGATPIEASWGIPWNGYMVGLENSDAEATPIAQGSLPILSLEALRFDITMAAKGWILDPATNFGLVFHSPTEFSGDYPDYPVFWASTAREAKNRPRLILDFFH